LQSGALTFPRHDQALTARLRDQAGSPVAMADGAAADSLCRERDTPVNGVTRVVGQLTDIRGALLTGDLRSCRIKGYDSHYASICAERAA
jgi:hypothetical protein